MKKFLYPIFAVLLFTFSSISLFALSITYEDTPQSYDSPIMLSQFEKDKAEIKDEKNVNEIYVAFYGPGKNFFEMFGHVAIIIEYSKDDEITYDYGVFNPSKPGFVWNVSRGFMFYELYRHINRYSLQNQMEVSKRYVRYYKLLNLSQAKKNDIAKFLNYNHSAYRNRYLYHFFNDNCSTRIRDILDIAYDGKLSEIGKRSFGTRRTAIETQISPYPITEMLYGIAGGSIQDREITYYEGMFLPSILEIALKEIDVVEFYSQNNWDIKYNYNANFSLNNSSWTPIIYIFIIIALINVIFHIVFTMESKRIWIKLYAIFNAIITILLFIISLIMCFMQLYTTIDCAWYNQNTIFINPLLLVLVILFVRIVFSRKKAKEKSLLIKTSYYAIFFLSLTLIALILKAFLPVQKNIVQIISFVIYYISLIDINSIIKSIINRYKG